MRWNNICRACCCEENKQFVSILFVATLGCISGGYMQTYLFSFLPEMILWFGYAETEKGLYGGFIASSYFLGVGLAGYIWGRLFDTRGSKVALVSTLIGNSLLCFLFAFTVDFYMAVALRFVCGLMNGTFQIGKALLHHISNNRNQATVMSFSCVGYAVGITIGPALGGYLANPVEKYPKLFHSSVFFTRFPYALPSFIGASFSAISALIVWYFHTKLNETHPDYKPLHEEESGHRRETSQYGSLHHTVHSDRTSDGVSYNVCDTDWSLDSTNETNTKVKEETALFGSNDCHKNDRSYAYLSRIFNRIRTSNMFILIQNSDVYKLVTLYTLYSAATLGIYDIFPIWTSTTIDLGGLAFGSSDIAFIYTVTTFPSLFTMLLVMPLFERRFGSLRTYMAALLASSIIVNILPTIRFLEGRSAVWICVCLFQYLFELFVMMGYASAAVICNNSVSGELVGAMNGLTVSAGALARAVSPVIGGTMFSTVIKSDIGPPIDASLPFVFFGAMFWTCAVFVIFFPVHLNKRKKPTIQSERVASAIENPTD